ncbi:hypothetical protein AB0K15_46560 [Amycolatopsis sp. NPDC049253]|uniref:hypothetical protein n=1 Tax=Amycolatopsis sp. NPDC049253 TaxID=3155274 RepID=UPI00341496FF
MTAPGGDFKLAGAYVEVRLKDETDGDEKRIRAKVEGEKPVTLDTALKDPKNAKIVKDKIERETKPVIKPEIDEKATRDSARKSGKAAEEELGRAAARANAQFDALKFAGLSAGLPLAAAIGAAGVLGALGVIPAAVIAMSAKWLIENDQVTESWGNLADDVQADAKKMASVLNGPLVDAAGQVRSAYTKIRPEIEDVFAGSVPAVEQLVGAGTDFAVNTMPGIVAAVQRSTPTLQGFRSLAGQTGSGLSDLLVALSSESDSAGQSLDTLGHIVRDLEGFIGQFLANLAAGSSGPLGDFRGALNQVYGIALTLSTSGMPALQGATGGFLGTVSGGLSIIQLFANLLGSWTGPLGEAGGSLLAVNSIAKLFGTSLAQTGFGIKALSPILDESGNKTTAFKQALNDADKGGTSKFKAGVQSLADGGFNPLGLALVAGGLLLDAWGKRAQDAATRAAEQRQAVSDLTKAYLEDNGAIGANVRATTQKALSDKNAFTNSQVFGASLKDTSAAALDGGASLDAYNQRAKDYITQLLSGSRANRQMTPDILAAADAFATQGGNASDLVNNLSAVRLHSLDLTDAQREQLIRTLDAITATNAEARANAESAKQAQALADAQRQVESVIARGTTPAMYAAQVASGKLDAAWSTLDQTGQDVAAAGQAIIDAMRVLSGQTPSVEEALQKWNDDLRGIKDSFKDLNLKSHSKDLVDASGAINTTSEAGSKLQDIVEQGATDLASFAQGLKDSGAGADEITAKLGPMRDQFVAQLKQLGLTDQQVQKVLEHYGLIPADITTQLGLEGDTETHAKVSGIIKDLKGVPDVKGVHVDALTAEAAKALQTFGYQVVALPDGTVQVFADTTAGKHAADVLRNNINQTQGTVTIYGNPDPATGAVANWKTATSRVIGNTTVTTDISPANGQVRTWKSTTDSTGAVTTTFTTTNPATGAVQTWVRNTNGTWATVNVGANTSSATTAIARVTGSRYNATVYVTANTSAIGGLQIRSSKFNATGGLYGPNVGFADGGFPVPTGMNAFNGLAQVVAPGTYKWAGDAKVPEVFIPLDRGSERSQRYLDQANEFMGHRDQPAGTTVEQHFHIYPPAESDPQRIAASVSNAVGWSVRGL